MNRADELIRARAKLHDALLTAGVPSGAATWIAHAFDPAKTSMERYLYGIAGAVEDAAAKVAVPSACARIGSGRT